MRHARRSGLVGHVAGTDLENLGVTMHPLFRAIMERSQGRYQAEGGPSTEDVRLRLAARRKALRRAEPKAG